jgi:hypothetical protein
MVKAEGWLLKRRKMALLRKCGPPGTALLVVTVELGQ